MEIKRILIANRSEIACRLQRTYQLFPLDPSTPRIETVAVHTPSESNALHVRNAIVRHQLQQEGPRAYLDAQALVDVARQHHCWAIAPGYGFLSEDAAFAQLCEQNHIVFLGPTSSQLRSLGNKISARSLARKLGVPLIEGTKSDDQQDHALALADIQQFAASLPPGSQIMLKAASGGGGRGIRNVKIQSSREATQKAVQQAFDSCSREAKASFGDGSIYAERFLVNAKHVEVQILGDGQGGIAHFWDRECSLQRRNQKMIEFAPAPFLAPALRQSIIDAAIAMAKAVNLRSLTTFEFLIDSVTEQFFFMEANPRIQVEHTVTECVTGFDLVALQLQIGLGKTLEQLRIPQQASPFPSLTSIQLRINAETFNPDGEAQPQTGVITSLYFPLGNHIRIETAVHPPMPGTLGQYVVSPLFDSLLAKLIVTAPSYASAVELARQTLEMTQIDGVKINASMLLSLLSHDAVKTAKHHIHTVQDNFPGLLQSCNQIDALRAETNAQQASVPAPTTKISTSDVDVNLKGSTAISTPFSGILVKLKVQKGDRVQTGQEIATIEAMKMEHVVRSARPGTVIAIPIKEGSVINADEPLVYIGHDSEATSEETGVQPLQEAVEDPHTLRPELQELYRRRKHLYDEGRSSQVEKRHARGYKTVRENIAMLVDPDSFVEYGDLVLAAQAARYSREELIQKTSGDGIITGWAKIDRHSMALAMGDYMVLAGTQGHFHHLKLDRIFTSVIEQPAPLVLYAEGGGGRPGDTDMPLVAGLQTPSFGLLGEIRARGIPTIGVANGYVFAGNAALLGTCDLVIATRGGSGNQPGQTSIGMGGKAMIEGGGLGVFESESIGPVDIHMKTGAIDVLVPSETEAASMTRKLVGYFTQATLRDRQWSYNRDPTSLRTCIPSAKDRKRAFDMRKVIEMIMDDGSLIELAPGWGSSIITGFGRIKGKAVAFIASDPSSSLGGAIDVPSALKAMRLMKLLVRTRAMHLISFCDTPGFMVGPEFERTAGGGGSFRVFGEWFSVASDLHLSGGRVIGLVIRRGFGLGAQAMLGGSTLRNTICASWPQGSFGAMGLEGAVRLGQKKQLEAIKDLDQRQQAEASMVNELYRRGMAINFATMAEMDTVIDPAETREWLSKVLDVIGERVPTFRQSRSALGSRL